MPEASQYTVDTSSALWKTTEEKFAKEVDARSKVIAMRWDYYDGNHRKHLKTQKDGHDDNVTVNDIEVLTEKLTAFLIGDGVTFDAGGDEESSDTDDQITALWEDNRGVILQGDLALSGCVEGHNAVRLMPSDDASLPSMSRIQQKHFAAFWNPFDMREVLWYRLQSGTRRIDYVRGGLPEEATSFDHSIPDIWTELVWETDKTIANTFGMASTKWKLIDGNIWPFPFPPVVDWQNLPNSRTYYGKSDLDAAIHLNDVKNFVLSNINRIIKHFSDPKTVGLGFNTSELIATQVGGFFTVNKPRSEVDIFNLEMQSDGALARWFAGVISEALWQSGGVVDPQTMKDKIGQITNFGLRILFADAIKKTDKKRALYAEAFELINKYSLEIAGQTPPDKVTTVWPDVLPEDELLEAQTLGLDLERKAISLETYRERRGYVNDREEERIEDERSNAANPLEELLRQGTPGIGFNR